jgi:hypothetical protein
MSGLLMSSRSLRPSIMANRSAPTSAAVAEQLQGHCERALIMTMSTRAEIFD